VRRKGSGMGKIVDSLFSFRRDTKNGCPRRLSENSNFVQNRVEDPGL